jgi:hypothetical protein
LDGRKEQADQAADDRDHDEQFDEREPAAEAESRRFGRQALPIERQPDRAANHGNVSPDRPPDPIMPIVRDS